MKNILLLIISLIFFSCGSRKKDLEKHTSETQTEDQAALRQNQSLENKTEATTDLSKFFSDKGLKITSNGQPYQFRYGDLTFSGSADVELQEKKQETKLHHKYYRHIYYRTQTTYKTETTYKTVLTDKKLKVEREAYPFWIFILIGFVGALLFKFLWKKLKLSQWYLNILNNG